MFCIEYEQKLIEAFEAWDNWEEEYMKDFTIYQKLSSDALEEDPSMWSRIKCILNTTSLYQAGKPIQAGWVKKVNKSFVDPARSALMPRPRHRV